jgi:hypothetical protein
MGPVVHCCGLKKNYITSTTTRNNPCQWIGLHRDHSTHLTMLWNQPTGSHACGRQCTYTSAAREAWQEWKSTTDTPFLWPVWIGADRPRARAMEMGMRNKPRCRNMHLVQTWCMSSFRVMGAYVHVQILHGKCDCRHPENPQLSRVAIRCINTGSHPIYWCSLPSKGARAMRSKL